MELDLHTRTMIVARVWMAVQFYFAHWPDVAPNFDLDAEISDLMKTAVETPDRLKFGLAMMRFFGQLNNSHTWYHDAWISETYFWKQNYSLRSTDDGWMVMKSNYEALKPGDIVTHVEGKSVDDWYAEIRPYVGASSDRIARRMFAGFLRIFAPDTTTLTLADGRKISVNPVDAKPPAPQSEATTGEWVVDGRIARMHIPSFNEPHYEIRALELVSEFKNARCLIIDLRDCGGGNTPGRLINALMNQPYRTWMEGTPANFAVFHYRTQERAWGKSHAMTKGDADEGYYNAMDEHFKRPMLVWDAPVNTPDADAYNGKIILLVGLHVGSAAEDFVIPFKNTRRATLIGETTFGSTGQPYHYQLDNGIWIAVGSKRVYFADGTRYEGVGIAPDIEIRPNAEALRNGKDIVMERALELANQA